MAIEVIRGLQIEPLFSFNYDVRVLGVEGSDEMRYRAQRVTVPGFTFTAEQSEEGNLRVKYAMEENVDEVTITAIETKGGPIWNFAQRWRSLIRENTRNRKMPREYKKLIYITKLDRQLKPNFTVVGSGAFLTRLSPYTLDHTDNTMVEIELVFSVDRVETLIGAPLSGVPVF